MSHRKPSFLTDSYDCDSTQSSVVVEQLRAVEEPGEHTVDYERCCVLHCAKCSTVIADSLSACGEAKSIKSIICLKVTQDVKVRGKFEVCLEGPLAFCTYRVLECGICHRSMGVILHSTPTHWSSLRNLFLLRKEVLNCYMLSKCTVVKATKVSFETRPIRKNIIELQQDLQAQLKQVEMLKEVLEEKSSLRVDQRRVRPNASASTSRSTALLTSGSK
ncbi:protein Mis18-beta [Astyanax mexicanus]|uniref:protein Mis18-beta n=1 Tax=Astyanax mexicanus TaxID=7994 RepID=UPI0020CB56C2|nr:protein Mis18-beta [Astyanax mexicanus]